MLGKMVYPPHIANEDVLHESACGWRTKYRLTREYRHYEGRFARDTRHVYCLVTVTPRLAGSWRTSLQRCLASEARRG